MKEWYPATVIGVRREEPQGYTVLLLKVENGSPLTIPIWVGPAEAEAIEVSMSGEKTRRPLTHELILNLLSAAERDIRVIRITAVREGVFYAEVLLDDDTSVQARPSDAVALAVRGDLPVEIGRSVVEEVGIPTAVPIEGSEVEAFREFLDQVSADDFLLSSELDAESEGSAGDFEAGGTSDTDGDGIDSAEDDGPR